MNFITWFEKPNLTPFLTTLEGILKEANIVKYIYIYIYLGRVSKTNEYYIFSLKLRLWK
jgi:hypothetical protein